MLIQALIAPDESNKIKETLIAKKYFQTTIILERFSVIKKKNLKYHIFVSQFLYNFSKIPNSLTIKKN